MPGEKKLEKEELKDLKNRYLYKQMPQKNQKGEVVFKDYPEFRPNLTPREIIKLGSFGGTYWRPIYSSVVNKNLKISVTCDGKT